jgi:Rieske Fe-S protein
VVNYRLVTTTPSPRPAEAEAETEAESENEAPSGPTVTRRAVLAGAAALGVGVVGAGALAACAPSSGPGPATGAPATGPVTVSVNDVPVGGGKIFEAQQVVVAQPVAGTFKAFTAICTHEGCVVASVRNGKITCPCHQSQFSALDGSVTQGPAIIALAARTVTRDGDTLTVN